jgi:hypothetical protein
MDAVVNVNSTYSFNTREAVPGLPNSASQAHRIATADHKLLLDFLYSVDPDCASKGFAAVRVVEAPKNGKLATEQGTGFPNFAKDNPRHECNIRKIDGVSVFYEPNSGFLGPDSIALDVIFPSGSLSKRRYSIDVKPPQIVELTRFVAIDQKLRLEFLYALIRIALRLDMRPSMCLRGQKTAMFPLRTERDLQTSHKTIRDTSATSAGRTACPFSMNPMKGSTGADSVTIDIVFPHGNATKRHYAIDVR